MNEHADDRGESVANERLQVSPQAVTIGSDWKAELSATPDGALLRVAQPGRGATLEITVVLTADGPVMRASAAALEIESETDLVARCGRFRVEARDSVEIVSGGTMRAEGRRVQLEATHGSVRVRANDDVQLLGENVLLNCDKEVHPMPAWVLPAPVPPEPSVPVQQVSGDYALALDKDP